MAKFVLVFLALCLTISSVYSLQCHNCAGPKDEVCSEYITCSPSLDSANNQPACIKRVTKVNGVTNVKRGCTIVSSPTFDKPAECQKEDVFCGSCKEDKCNSAPTLNKFSLYAILSVFIALIFAN